MDNVFLLKFQDLIKLMYCIDFIKIAPTIILLMICNMIKRILFINVTLCHIILYFEKYNQFLKVVIYLSCECLFYLINLKNM